MSRPLVLLPGMLCDERLWAGLPLPADALALPLTGTDLASAVTAVLDAAPPTFDLLGLSLGGIVAMAVVAACPERVGDLVLVATNPRPPTAAQRAGWDALERRCDEGRFAEVTPQVLLPSLLSPARLADERLRGVVVTMAEATGEAAFRDQLALQRSRVDLRPGLAAHRGRATVVWPELDALCSEQMHAEVVKGLPEARLVPLPGVGHLATLEAPEAFAPLLPG